MDEKLEGVKNFAFIHMQRKGMFMFYELLILHNVISLCCMVFIYAHRMELAMAHSHKDITQKFSM